MNLFGGEHLQRSSGIVNNGDQCIRSRTNFLLRVKSGYRIEKFDLGLANFCDSEILEFGVALGTSGSRGVREF